MRQISKTKKPSEMINLFNEVSHSCSRITTNKYSTSFSNAILFLHKDLRGPVYDIYGFVRLADEIVDSFLDYDRQHLLETFYRQTMDAISRGLSLNPILHSFQATVNKYEISTDLIHAFFASMQMDLNKKKYNEQEYSGYIYGSAEAVGLMCLTVFCGADRDLYEHLKPAAQSLGAAFQKLNFLRDMGSDYQQLQREYFPGVSIVSFDPEAKSLIESDIEKDFRLALTGIRKLPLKARFGVYLAYKYYFGLFRKIKRTHPQRILKKRIRIPGYVKAWLAAKAMVRAQLNLM